MALSQTIIQPIVPSHQELNPEVGVELNNEVQQNFQNLQNNSYVYSAISNYKQENRYLAQLRNISLELNSLLTLYINEAISFKPQLCQEVPSCNYASLKSQFIDFTGTTIRRNKSKLYYLPTNMCDEIQQLNPSIPTNAKNDFNTIYNKKRAPINNAKINYYKNRLITELDYENLDRVEIACFFIAFSALNSYLYLETDENITEDNNKHSRTNVQNGIDEDQKSKSKSRKLKGKNSHSSSSRNSTNETNENYDDEFLSSFDGVKNCIKKGYIIGFRELGFLVGITPWHFHRVFKTVTGVTIREYGQLCVDFIKLNEKLINDYKLKMNDLKLRYLASSSTAIDEIKSFLFYPIDYVTELNFFHVVECFKSDISQVYKNFITLVRLNTFENTVNVNLINNNIQTIFDTEYFIDPTKSKEFKKSKLERSKQSPDCDGSSTVYQESSHNKKTRLNNEVRKQRSLVMNGRIKVAFDTLLNLRDIFSFLSINNVSDEIPNFNQEFNFAPVTNGMNTGNFTNTAPSLPEAFNETDPSDGSNKYALDTTSLESPCFESFPPSEELHDLSSSPYTYNSLKTNNIKNQLHASSSSSLLATPKKSNGKVTKRKCQSAGNTNGVLYNQMQKNSFERKKSSVVSSPIRIKEEELSDEQCARDIINNFSLDQKFFNLNNLDDDLLVKPIEKNITEDNDQSLQTRKDQGNNEVQNCNESFESKNITLTSAEDLGPILSLSSENSASFDCLNNVNDLGELTLDNDLLLNNFNLNQFENDLSYSNDFEYPFGNDSNE
ncbi:hypothetical protein Kpol_295p6 [Vanderwaltozyma polyspora DSM 70294]|uniref:Uncharacterized protein n=1 Tax=Vanderwaltozyma polyspora (strain ATCC 22028 / DSM 70294 / BCRC 21397 / CBS 2163 / NBRC 10782 / NRRL Y-8283 / UCD 57-17) TaxID=436907 RepID=A7TT20_VANPO|nr:uncharacterized protein Kpol_295p6 [Vanderwaltozyma polyspora DSM 70294]EDO14590.1 hypothetical protein Kpol_295p6 [Vanderwaltozyma polyspora DSM 70294]